MKSYKLQVTSHLILLLFLTTLAFTPATFAEPQESILSQTIGQGESSTPIIHLPYFNGEVPLSERAIFWFGEISNTSNYADVRVGYNNENIVVQIPVFDRLLYFDNTPTVAELEDWDSVSLYLNLDGNVGSAPSTNSYWFIGQHNKSQGSTTHYGVYRGNGNSWVQDTVAFTLGSGTQASGFNDQVNDRGYWLSFVIPFESLGLSERPEDGTVWGASLAVHDRDSDVNTNIPTQVWPNGANGDVPNSYGRFSFNTPVFTVPSANNVQTSIIRQGENGIVVPDGHAGGHSTCGQPFWPDKYFSGWGLANYAGYREINIQNQFNLGDWPCFSKYYVSFPLDSIPSGKVIRSATLSMYQFGNAGQNTTPIPQPTLIQVMTTDTVLNESVLNWNNGPQVQENVGSEWTGTIPAGGDGFFVEWDVSRAVSEALDSGGSLNLALYTSDGNRNSGKYFVSSDGAASKPARRPTLIIEWGDPPLKVTPVVQSIEGLETAVYTISAEGLGSSVNLSFLNPATDSLNISLSQTTISPPQTAALTVTDTSGTNKLYEIPVTAQGNVLAETAVYLLVDGQQIYLPIVTK